MVFTLKDMDHLKIMAGLESQEAVAPSLPSPEDIIGDTFESTSKEDFTKNILSLCSKLRVNGFVKAATSLEDKFLTYKIAKTHIYNTHNETGEDLVEFAHPDADKEVAPASDRKGEVHNSVSKHKIIVDVIQKEPNGKLAGYVKSCKIILGQETAIDKVQASAIEKINLIPKFLAEAKSIIDNYMVTTTLGYNFNKNVGEINAEISSIVSKKHLTAENIDNILGDLEDINNSLKILNWKDLLLLFTFPRHIGDLTDAVRGKWGQEYRDRILVIISKAIDAANSAENILKNNISTITTQQEQNQSDKSSATQIDKKAELVQKINTFKKNINENTKISDQIKLKINSWLDERLAYVNNVPLNAESDKIFEKITNQVNTIEASWK